MTDDERRAEDRAAGATLVLERLAHLGWSAEHLRADQTAQLRALVHAAKTGSPWHAARLAAVDPERLELEDLARLPTMSKDDLMTHFDDIVTDRRLTRVLVEGHLSALHGDAYLLDEYHALASGGSSGRRGVFVFDRLAWRLLYASYSRFMLQLGATAGPLPPNPVLATVAADKPTHATLALGLTFNDAEGARLSASWPLDRLVAALEARPPDVLMGYATVIARLAREALAGRLRISPKLVNATSEPLLPDMRAAIEAAWHAPVFNGFGTTEGLMGGSCAAGRGLHMSEDLVVIEPVDAAGRPVPPGTRADKVYLTVLYNTTQPLIRYELTDPFTVLPGPCPCGTTLLRVDDIEGRRDDGFAYADGIVVHPFAFRSPLGRTPSVIEYQVRQTSAGADVLVVCESATDLRALEAALREALGTAGLPAPVVTVAAVDALPRLATGKLRRFVPLA